MADDKLNTNPQENTPPDIAALLGSDTPPEHEQAVISGMGEEAPAPAGKVIDLSDIKAAADRNDKETAAPDVTAKPSEAVPDQNRRGRPPKEQAGVSARKKEKAAEPRTGRPSKVDKAAREEAPPAVRDKVSRGKKADKGKETGSGGAPVSKPAKAVKPDKAAPVKEAAVPPEINLPPTPDVPPRPVEEGKIVYLKMAELHPFHTFREHPYKVQDDKAMDDLVGTIKEHGIMTPATVRPEKDGKGYEIIAGHRRHHGGTRAGLEEMPCIVREMTDLEAVREMRNSNKQRGDPLPSELAKLLDLEVEAMNAVDYMFKGLEKRKPDCFAVKQYKKYKLASGKTAKSILISCGSRLAPFDIPQLREIMSYDELELDRIGDRKTAVFFTISDTTPTYNFIVALAFSQMFNLLCERADNVHGGRLPHHVRVLWDEAANTGQVPSLEKLVAVIRSREVSVCLFYQQYAQCKAIYKDNAETILGNMDSVVFLGGRESSTIKEISENWLGKATISMQTEGRSRGQSESYNQNTQRLGRELMTPSELATMPGDKCILQLRGLPPFFSPKYDLKQHPNYKYTAEADKQKNAFDLDKLINRRRRPGLNEACEVYEVDGSDTGPVSEDEDILNYDDVDDPDDYV